ncbi:MAG: hypothetical protein SOT37_02805, partial [Oscillospiraceae bacterium]|nr:hypothetical protein [Oscillospiraceae bacterium]
VFAFAACKKDKDNSDTTAAEANTSANGETIANDESSEAESVSGDESTEAQTDASGNTVAPATEKNTQGSGSQGGISTASKPSTKAEIVAYFNKAINNVKPNAKSVTRVSETNYRSGNITGVPSIVDKLVGGIDSFVDGQLKKNSKGSETFSNSAAIKANFPVENESWSSKLTANDVASATCTEAGGVYTITIKTVADKASSNVHHGSGHAPKVFSVVLPSVINDQFSSGVLKSVAKTFKIGTAQMEYPSGTVTVKVDAKTSRVINATYDAKWTIHLPLGDEMVVLPFGTKTIYNIAY